MKFTDAPGFFRYARELGAEGVQTPLRSQDATVAKQMRQLIDESGGYYEGELRLPKVASDLAAFEAETKLILEAGATVARAVFTGGRRYETFKALDEFRAFHDQAGRTLTLIEPVLREAGGRPHWGKLHSLGAKELAGLYPMWAEARAVRRAADPQGRMLNPFLRKLFGE